MMKQNTQRRIPNKTPLVTLRSPKVVREPSTPRSHKKQPRRRWISQRTLKSRFSDW